ncbi:unnamed protein product [Orchesella dallaii]|uniref:Uncharacterized protein n=1 Tax=Orchesella dallaii TaxID=48710 RepID=A0ABP1RPF0_9HEXA
MNCVKWKLSCDFVSFPLENYCIVNILNTRTFITMFHQSFQSNQLPKHLLILVMFLHVFNSQFVPVQSSLFPNIIVEMTKQFQRVLSKELAMTDFISVFNSHAILGGGVAFENSSQTWLYKTDCKIMEANTCAEEITSVVRLINETFGEHMNKIDLMISMTMNVSTIIKLGDANSFNKIKLPEFPLKIFVNLHENTKCEDLVGIGYGTWDTLVNTERWMTIYPTTKKGFGYPESLIPCSGKAMSQPINKADFLVLNLKFGNTIGVTESYGLFEKRMNSLHENNVRFARHNLHFTVTKKLQTIYYPTPKAVGDDEGHRQLLMKYAERWTTEKGKKIVIQAPFFEPESITEFSLGTFIESNTCSNFNTEIKNLQWYVPSALAAISEHFDALIIKHGMFIFLHLNGIILIFHKNHFDERYIRFYRSIENVKLWESTTNLRIVEDT